MRRLVCLVCGLSNDWPVGIERDKERLVPKNHLTQINYTGALDMNRMAKMILEVRMKFRHLMHGETGQDLVEYGLLVSLIALTAISGVKNVATAVNLMFGNVSSSLG
jgi:Flp pilus assembly pilin Flp